MNRTFGSDLENGMGQIEDLHTYVSIIDAGGIARAAEKLNIAKSAVSRRLALLEDRYDIQLVDRRPGIWAVSAAGQELYQRAVRIVAEADEIEADFTHAKQSLSGPLSISLPREYGLDFLQPFLLRFASDYPEIQLTMDFDNRHVDLDHENYDLAIRISDTVPPGQITKRLGKTQHRLYASPDYARRAGLPETIEALPKHPLLHHGAARRVSWEFQTCKGRQIIEFQPAMNSNSGRFLLAATREGCGIARLPDFVATAACARGELLTVLPEVSIRERNIVLTYSKKRLLNRRMRRFIEELSSACGEYGETGGCGPR